MFQNSIYLNNLITAIMGTQRLHSLEFSRSNYKTHSNAQPSKRVYLQANKNKD